MLDSNLFKGFHPQETGMVRDIEQVLLPDAKLGDKKFKGVSREKLGVIMEVRSLLVSFEPVSVYAGRGIGADSWLTMVLKVRTNETTQGPFVTGDLKLKPRHWFGTLLIFLPNPHTGK